MNCIRHLNSKFLALVATAASVSAASFNDGSFTSWSTTSYNGYNLQSVTTQTSGGNPGNYLQVMTTGNETQFTVNLSPFSINPASTPISSLSYSLDVKEFQTFGQGMAFGLAVFQGGTAYLGDYNITDGAYTSWTTHSSPSLTQGNFLSATSSNPDFSATGAPITLEFYTGNSGGQGITVGYDNFKVEATTTSTSNVPDGGASAFMVLVGVGVVVAARRKISA